MIDLEQVERYARLNEGGQSKWKKKALALCAENMETIRVFRALGLGAIIDPDTKILVGKHIGPEPPDDVSRDEYGFNVWLLNELADNREMSDDNIFFVCRGCNTVRSQRGIHRSHAKICPMCGTNLVAAYNGPTETRDNLYRLVSGI